MNVVVIAGRLSGPPSEKVLPSGTRIMSMQVTAAGGAAQADGKAGRAETVPVAWFDPPAVAVELDEGDEVVVLGRVRRRFFRAGSVTQSRTEVVADRVIPARRAAAVRTALAAAVERLASGLEPAQETPPRRRARSG